MLKRPTITDTHFSQSGVPKPGLSLITLGNHSTDKEVNFQTASLSPSSLPCHLTPLLTHLGKKTTLNGCPFFFLLCNINKFI